MTIPPSDLDEFNALPQTVRDTIRRRLATFRRADDLMRDAGMSQTKALQAVSTKAYGLTYGVLKKYYPAYRRTGDWHILIDGRHEAAPESNADLKAWAQGLIASNKRATGKAAAWRAGIRQLATGEVIPGYGTWQQIWRRENPGQPLPAACPYSELPDCQPKKLSQRNFYRLSATPKHIRALALSGSAASRSALSGLLEFDTSQLRTLEFIAFDDVRSDFKVFDPVTRQVVELWMLVAMDIGSRCFINFGVRPRRIREDGTAEGLTRRDMQHLVVGILRKYGYPTNYNCTLLVENASAAITTGFEAALLESTGGRVNVRRTPMLKGNPFLEGFGEEGRGNPKAKGWLESSFRLMHEEAGSIKGQIGADYSLKSQSHSPAQRFTEKLVESASPILHLLDRRVYGIPFESLPQATCDLEEIFVRMNNRRNHSLTGFDKIREWQWKGQPTWNPWNTFPNLPTEALASINAREIAESPWMRLQRLAAAEKFTSLPASCMHAMLADHAVCTYHGGQILTFKREGKAYRFDCGEHRIAEGTEVTAWFNFDRIEEDGIFITDGKGRSYGHAPRTMRINPMDQESLHAGTKHKQKRFAQGLAEFRSANLTEAVWNRRQEDADENLATLDLARAAIPAPRETTPAAQLPAAPGKGKKTAHTMSSHAFTMAMGKPGKNPNS